MRIKILTLILVTIGLSQILGHILNVRSLISLGRLTGASPFPHVFSSIKGHEYWARAYSIHLFYRDGTTQKIGITSEQFNKIRGNHLIKMSYALSLSLFPILEGIGEGIWKYGLCGAGPVFRDLGLKGDLERIKIETYSDIERYERRINCKKS